MPALPLLTHTYFEGLLEQSFHVSAGDQTMALRLTEVRMLPPPKRRTLTGKLVEGAVARLPFSIYFRGEGDRGLPQGMYDMTPPNGDDPLSIFVVPLGIEDGGMIYEAIFN